MQLLPSMLADPMCALGGGASVPDTTAPTILSGAAHTQGENSAWLLTLVADEPVTWSKVGGADQALFTLVGDQLSLTAKDYETPTDADTNNTYIVQVRATDGSNNQTNQTITVTISDVAEGANDDDDYASWMAAA